MSMEWWPASAGGNSARSARRRCRSRRATAGHGGRGRAGTGGGLAIMGPASAPRLPEAMKPWVFESLGVFELGVIWSTISDLAPDSPAPPSAGDGPARPPHTRARTCGRKQSATADRDRERRSAERGGEWVLKPLAESLRPEHLERSFDRPARQEIVLVNREDAAREAIRYSEAGGARGRGNAIQVYCLYSKISPG